MDYGTAAIVIATFCGPIAAVQAQKIVENITQKRRDKREVFAALMYTRDTRLSVEHIQALNRIDLAFYGDDTVLEAWRAYLDVLMENPTEDNWPYVVGKRDERFLRLLFSMSKLLRYKFTETEIKNSSYRPNAHREQEQIQLKLVNALSAIAEGRQSLSVRIQPL
jgi:hypothetical protein